MYASGIHGKAGLEPDQLADDLEPLFEAVIRCIPEPRVDIEGPLQMLVSGFTVCLCYLVYRFVSWIDCCGERFVVQMST